MGSSEILIPLTVALSRADLNFEMQTLTLDLVLPQGLAQTFPEGDEEHRRLTLGRIVNNDRHGDAVLRTVLSVHSTDFELLRVFGQIADHVSTEETTIQTTEALVVALRLLTLTETRIFTLPIW